MDDKKLWPDPTPELMRDVLQCLIDESQAEQPKWLTSQEIGERLHQPPRNVLGALSELRLGGLVKGWMLPGTIGWGAKNPAPKRAA